MFEDGAKLTQENVSMDMAEKDYMNYLPDDSTLSSPLIPLDVISENGISKKLNFRQLNDALNTGRIQLFPNGPRTPTTDRKAKQRFWHGLEQQPMEEEVPNREKIKPRSTINFNESMMVSPVAPEKSEAKLVAAAQNADPPVKAKNSLNAKRNYRFSQADELMLDNTNFLVNAKMGDETHSRNSSKCSSRRETTYDNTAMEFDDLEKREAAVKAALEGAKHKQTMHHFEPMEQDDFSSPGKNAKSDLTMPPVVQQSIQIDLSPQATLPAQHRSKPRSTLLMAEPIEEEHPKYETAASKKEFNVRRRQTLHLAEPIDEDVINPVQELQSNEQQYNNRQQTLHVVDFMEEDSIGLKDDINSQTAANAALVKLNSNKQRQTLHMTEPIEEESLKHQHESKSQTHASTSVLEKDVSRRRQSIHLPEPIEEDSFCAPTAAPKEVRQNKNRHTMHMSEFIETDYGQTRTADPEGIQQYTRRRQTLLLSESIEEISVPLQREVQLQLKSNAVDFQCSRRRQTLHMADPIEEDSYCATSTAADRQRDQLQSDKPVDIDNVKPQEEIMAQSARIQGDPQYNRRRQTVLMADPIEDDSMCSTSTAAEQQRNEHKKRRQTLHRADDIEEDSFYSKSIAAKQHAIGECNRRRQTLLQDDPIEEDSICSASTAIKQLQPRLQNENSVKEAGSNLDLQCYKRRQTLHVDDPIEEDSFCLTSTSANQHKHNLQRDATIKEDILKSEQNIKEQSAAPKSNLECIQRRQTLHLPEPIEEDSICSTSNAAKLQWDECNRRRQTLHQADPIVEDSCYSISTAANSQRVATSEDKSLKPEEKKNMASDGRRKTTILADPIEEDSYTLTSLSANLHRHTLQKAEPIAEVILKSLKEIRQQTADFKVNSRRQTTHLADPIEEDSFCSSSNAANKQRRNAAIEEDISNQGKQPDVDQVSLQAYRPRQTLHVVDSMEEDSFCSKSTAVSKDNPCSKDRKTMLIPEAIDVDMNFSSTHSVAPAKKGSIKHRQTLLLSESIQEDNKSTNCNQLPNLTLNLSDGIDEVMSNADKTTKQQSAPVVDQYDNRSRQTHLLKDASEADASCVQSKTKAETMQLERKPRHTQYKEEAMDVDMSNVESTDQCYSRPRPKLKNDLLRKALDKENVFINTRLETPEMNKKRQMFALTPGRSMIEFEDLENDCKIKTPAAKTACRSIYQAIDMELDMDTSNYVTPEKKTSFNGKRIPIHLTPNLPDPKKRSMHRHLNIDQENT